jgi:hypothetical protein
VNNSRSNVYARYTTVLPNRKVLSAAVSTSKYILAILLAANAWNSFVLVTDRYDDYRVIYAYECPSGDMYFGKYCVFTCTNTDGFAPLMWSFDHWYVAVIALIAAFVARRYVVRFFNKYFRDVWQGKVISKDTVGGGRYPLEWALLVEGNTQANELRRQWKYVSHGLYAQTSIGSFVDLR